MFWAEKALTKAIPNMIQNATSLDLIETLTEHLEKTNQHVERLAIVFASIDKKPVAKKCEAIAGLIQLTKEIMEACDEGPIRDAAIISAAHKVEHYEIATYGILRQLAVTLKLVDAVKILTTTLEEVKAADKKLSDAARLAINIDTSEIA